MTVQDLLHKRILVSEKQGTYSKEAHVVEIKILEISPSGLWVKIQNMNGNQYWKHFADIQPIEVLARIERNI